MAVPLLAVGAVRLLRQRPKLRREMKSLEARYPLVYSPFGTAAQLRT
jgi:hypothetical protein